MIDEPSNRLHITEALGEAMHEADRWRGRCAFLMIDLDRFKAVNDTLGHPVGDRLLTRVAERLRSIMTDNEVCGRLGGDEFAVVVKDANDPGRLAKFAQTIIETLSRPYEVDQHTLYIGASIGTATGPRDGRTVETLIRSADLALYRSKDEGGGQAHSYEPQLHVHAEERRVIEIALRKALERNEFEVHYQPVVGAENSEVESFEALLRWTNPELGPVSPAKFVPVAEDTRLIAPIGDWVLRVSCLEQLRLQALGLPGIRMSVNVSQIQFRHPEFLTKLSAALRDTGINPKHLELEITESVAMEDPGFMLDILHRVRAMGISIAIDDFGTGYSSLSHLRQLPIDRLKIDRAFVTELNHEVLGGHIASMVIELGRNLNLTVIAEGIEDAGQAQTLLNMGCHEGQGYLYAKPLTSPQLVQWIQAHNDTP